MSTIRIPGNSCLAAPKLVGGLAYVIQGAQKSCLDEKTRAFQSQANVQAALADILKLLDGPLRPALVVFVQKINCEGHITFPGFKRLPQEVVQVDEGTILFPGTAGVQGVIEYTFTPARTSDPIKMTVHQTERNLDRNDEDTEIIDQLKPYVKPRERSAVEFENQGLWYKSGDAKGAKQKLRVCVPQKGNTCASAVWLTGQQQYFPHSSAVVDNTGYNLIKNGDESLLDVFEHFGIGEVVLAGLAPSQDLLRTASDLTMQGIKVSVVQSATPCVFQASPRNQPFDHTLAAQEHVMDSSNPLYRAHVAHSLKIRVYPTLRSFTSQYVERVHFKTLPGGNVSNNTKTPDLEFKLYATDLPTRQSTWNKLREQAQDAALSYTDKVTTQSVQGDASTTKPQGAASTELQRLLAIADPKSSEFVQDKYVVICNEGSRHSLEPVGAEKFLPRSKRWASLQRKNWQGEFVSAIFCVRPTAFGFVTDSDEGTMQLIKEMLEFRDSVAMTLLLALMEQVLEALGVSTQPPMAAPSQTKATTAPPTKADNGGAYSRNDSTYTVNASAKKQAAGRSNDGSATSPQQQQQQQPRPGQEIDLRNLYIALFLVYQEALRRYMEAANGTPKSQGQCLAEIGFGWGSYTEPVTQSTRSPELYGSVRAYQKCYWQDNGRAMLGSFYDQHRPKLKQTLVRNGLLQTNDSQDNDLAEIVGATFTGPLQAFDLWAEQATKASLQGENVTTATRARKYMCLDDVLAFLEKKKTHEQQHPQCVSRSPSHGAQREFIAYAGPRVRPYVPQGAALSYVAVYPMPRCAEDLHPGLFHVLAKDLPVDPTQSEQSSEPVRIALMLMPSNCYYNTQHYAENLPFPVRAVAPFAFMQEGHFMALHSPGNPCELVGIQ